MIFSDTDDDESLPEGAELLITDAHGIYIPQYWAQNFAHRAVKGTLDPDVLDDLLAGPYQRDPEAYNWAWDEVIDRCIIANDNEELFTIVHDGDVWAVPVQPSN